jgi:anti-anti-sigma factor
MSLRQDVRASLQPGVEIVIDLSPVEFIDAVGMQAVIGSVRLARAFGATARVCNARPSVQRLMELVGVYPLVTVSPATATSGDAAHHGVRRAGALETGGFAQIVRRPLSLSEERARSSLRGEVE